MRIRYSLEELEATPTLCVGQAEDLKFEDMEEGWRVWLSRCTVSDGEPYNNKVTVEKRDSYGCWRNYLSYRAR